MSNRFSRVEHELSGHPALFDLYVEKLSDKLSQAIMEEPSRVWELAELLQVFSIPAASEIAISVLAQLASEQVIRVSEVNGLVHITAWASPADSSELK